MDERLRVSVIEFVKSYFNAEGKVPSIAKILTECRTNRAAFYRCFPLGLSEACKEAFVPEPSERMRRVQTALLEKVRKKGDADLKQSEMIEQYPITATLHLEDRMKDYARKIVNLERDAMKDISKVPAFAREFVPRANRGLWWKLSLLTKELDPFADTDMDQFVRVAMTLVPSYEGRLKNAIVLRLKRPSIRDHILNALNVALQRAIDRKLYSQAPPAQLDGTCSKCHLLLRCEKSWFGKDSAYVSSLRSYYYRLCDLRDRAEVFSTENLYLS
ncbi:MAG: hypothetical protein V1850_03500 [Candidatus Bathyarchaeota archaeon]